MNAPSAHDHCCCHFAHIRTATNDELHNKNMVVHIVKALPIGMAVVLSVVSMSAA